MDKTNAQYRQDFRTRIVPRYYWPLGHVLFNFSGLIFLCVYCLLQLNNPTYSDWLVLVFMLIVGNIAVYLIHKYLLHRRLPLIGKLTYDIHSKMHHKFYTDKAIVYDGPRDFYILFFPPWTVLGFGLIFMPMMYLGLAPFFEQNIVWLTLFGSALYFLLYETLHYISHLPESHFVLKLKLLRYM